MNVLVTGGAGYIGSHTCVELLEKGYGVVVIDNLVNSSAKSLERVEQITGKSLDFYQNDVRDRDAMERIFSKPSANPLPCRSNTMITICIQPSFSARRCAITA